MKLYVDDYLTGRNICSEDIKSADLSLIAFLKMVGSLQSSKVRLEIRLLL